MPLQLVETIWKDERQIQHKHKCHLHLNAVWYSGTEKGICRKTGEIQNKAYILLISIVPMLVLSFDNYIMLMQNVDFRKINGFT